MEEDEEDDVETRTLEESARAFTLDNVRPSSQPCTDSGAEEDKPDISSGGNGLDSNLEEKETELQEKQQLTPPASPMPVNTQIDGSQQLEDDTQVRGGHSQTPLQDTICNCCKEPDGGRNGEGRSLRLAGKRSVNYTEFQLSEQELEVGSYPLLEQVKRISKLADARLASKFKVRKVQGMGLGLFTREVTIPGQEIEYHGEARTAAQQKEWTKTNGKSEYAFETSTGAVIDATRVLGLASRANHSSDPKTINAELTQNGQSLYPYLIITRAMMPNAQVYINYNAGGTGNDFEITEAQAGARQRRDKDRSPSGTDDSDSCSEAEDAQDDRTATYKDNPLTTKGKARSAEGIGTLPGGTNADDKRAEDAPLRMRGAGKGRFAFTTPQEKLQERQKSYKKDKEKEENPAEKATKQPHQTEDDPEEGKDDDEGIGTPTEKSQKVVSQAATTSDSENRREDKDEVEEEREKREASFYETKEEGEASDSETDERDVVVGTLAAEFLRRQKDELLWDYLRRIQSKKDRRAEDAVSADSQEYMDDNLLLQAATTAWKALRMLGERGKEILETGEKLSLLQSQADKCGGMVCTKKIFQIGKTTAEDVDRTLQRSTREVQILRQ